MIYITGDTHSDFSRIGKIDLKEEDLFIVLGDAGINYFLNQFDDLLKKQLNRIGCKFFFIRGNHEERPENIRSYHLTTVNGIVDGTVWMENRYPNLMFANDDFYLIDQRRCLVLNGACSVDKDYRMKVGGKWFPDEELSREEIDILRAYVSGEDVDCILTHTCPEKFIPPDRLLPSVDQSKVSHRMEKFFDEVEEKVGYAKWYCGHWHTDRTIEKIRFMYKDIIEF